MELIAALERSTNQTAGIVSGVKADQLGDPTPCADWDVRTLINHLVGSVTVFTSSAKGEDMDMSVFGKDLIGDDDPAAAYARRSKALIEAWRQPGATDGEREMPFGKVPASFGAQIALTETLIHGWDLARATNQQVDFDPEVTEFTMGIAKQFPAEQVRQAQVWGPEQQAPDGAPPEDQLAAFVGRQV